MTVDPQEADALLKGIAGAEKRTREVLVYARAGDYLILWGVLWAVGYAVADRIWPYTRDFWLALDGVGILGTSLITWQAARCNPERRFVFVRPAICILVLMAFGSFWTEVARFDGRQQSAFWPTICGAILFCFGLWAGRTLAVGGALIVALTVAGYFWSGPWFDLWLAVTTGGAMILGGLWLRR